MLRLGCTSPPVGDAALKRAAVTVYRACTPLRFSMRSTAVGTESSALSPPKSTDSSSGALSPTVLTSCACRQTKEQTTCGARTLTGAAGCTSSVGADNCAARDSPTASMGAASDTKATASMAGF